LYGVFLTKCLVWETAEKRLDLKGLCLNRSRSSTLGTQSSGCGWQGVFVDVFALRHAHACMLSNGVLLERHLIYHPHHHACSQEWAH
jgi:hypothetical protein